MSDPFTFLAAEITKFKESDSRRDQLLIVSLLPMIEILDFTPPFSSTLNVAR
jgi:hypothetical protein